MGQVFLATDVALERRVAIKVVHAHVERPKETRARFTRELPNGADCGSRVVSGAAKSEGVRWRFSSLGVARFAQKPIVLDALVAEIRGLAVENGWVVAVARGAETSG